MCVISELIDISTPLRPLACCTLASLSKYYNIRYIARQEGPAYLGSILKRITPPIKAIRLYVLFYKVFQIIHTFQMLLP